MGIIFTSVATQVLLLSSLNIIPVNFNELVEDHMGRDERSTRSVSRINNSTVYQVRLKEIGDVWGLRIEHRRKGMK